MSEIKILAIQFYKLFLGMAPCTTCFKTSIPKGNILQINHWYLGLHNILQQI